MDPGHTPSIHKRSSSPSPDARVPKRPRQSAQQPPFIEHSFEHSATASGEDGGFSHLLMGHDELFGAGEHGLTLPDGSAFFYARAQAQAQAQATEPDNIASSRQHREVAVDPLLLGHSSEEASQGTAPNIADDGVPADRVPADRVPDNTTAANMAAANMPGIMLDGPALEFVIDESLFLQPDITFGGVETSSVGLGIPPSIPDDEFARRIDAMRAELAQQAASLPLLPESQVSALPPKPNPPAYHAVPKDASPAERERLTELNNNIALQEQTLDKMRNNQAAKKSRQTRVEALENTTAMLHESVVEARWLRLKVLALGGDLGDWDAVPRDVRDGIATRIAERVRDVKEAADREKKRAERERRTLDNRQRKRRLQAEAAGGAVAAADEEAGLSTSTAAGSIIKKETSVKAEEGEGDGYENGETQGGDEPEDTNNNNNDNDDNDDDNIYDGHV
ncbi:hypothetical protein ESCO_005206 [Escovopsis weberi]|uniref:BZIP domain-containing protein n=1 Tax=Escovopsis weberi TaxID=150374 RepID=A0A0M9VVX9_ESCWE|nr:hypothetical protein ESCO_005206 [Escovopsis weberi]